MLTAALTPVATAICRLCLGGRGPDRCDGCGTGSARLERMEVGGGQTEAAEEMLIQMWNLDGDQVPSGPQLCFTYLALTQRSFWTLWIFTIWTLWIQPVLGDQAPPPTPTPPGLRPA